jgi:chaperonin GroES
MATKTNSHTSLLPRLQPTAGLVLVEPQETAKQTTSGIYLPETASGDKPQRGTVLAVGPDEITEAGTKRSSPVKVGNEVIYKKWGGNDVKIDNKEYMFIKFDDILAVIK